MNETILWQSNTGKVWRSTTGDYGTMGSQRLLLCELAEEAYRNAALVSQVVDILGKHGLRNVLDIAQRLDELQSDNERLRQIIDHAEDACCMATFALKGRHCKELYAVIDKIRSLKKSEGATA